MMLQETVLKEPLVSRKGHVMSSTESRSLICSRRHNLFQERVVLKGLRDLDILSRYRLDRG